MIQDLAIRDSLPQQTPILLIEPDPANRDRLSRWLIGLGHTVRAVERPAEAVETLAGQGVGVVLVRAAAGPAGESITGELLDLIRVGGVAVMVYGEHLTAAGRVGLLTGGADDVVAADGPTEELALKIQAAQRLAAMRRELGGGRARLGQDLLRQRRVVRRVRRRNRRLRELAFTEPLTGLNNVRFFRQWMATQFEIARRYNLVLALLMIDIDNFKRLNDQCGHPFGDYVLAQFAQLLRDQARASDVVARVGGDEFVVGLVETGRQDATRFARRLLRAVAACSFEYYGQAETITVSIGQACFPEDSGATDADRLILFADRALYQAKANGRNDLACWHELDPTERLRLSTPGRASPPMVFSQPTVCLMQED